MKKIYIILVCMLSVLLSVAQTRSISGKVSDQTGPIPGVSIKVEGTSIGSTTDNKGMYVMKGVPAEGKLVFSGIGYKTVVEKLQAKNVYNVLLEESIEGLNEVVVVGFGTQKKATLTGSISSLGGKELKQSPVANLTNALSGRLPGLFAQQNSGQPGKDESAIQIRGVSTYRSGTGPLLIVDGVQQDNIGQIDMNEVENISILKDASATAVYGIRGANGVIIVTTRRGQTGEAQVSVSNQTGIQQSTRLPKLLDAYNSLLLVKESYVNDGQAANFPYTDSQLEEFRLGTNPSVYPNVNWYDEVMRPYSLQTQFNANVSGGTENVKYFVSAGMMNQNGLFKEFKQSETDNTYYFKRYNFRSNLDIKVNSNLDIGIDLSSRLENINQPHPAEAGRSVFNQLLRTGFAPYSFPVYNPDGSFAAPPQSGQHPNMVAQLTLAGYDRSYNTVMTSTVNAVHKLDFLLKGLSARAAFAFNNTQYSLKSLFRNGYPTYRYNPTNDTYSLFNVSYPVLRPYELATGNLAPKGSTNLEAALNYANQFGKHNLTVLGLYNQNTKVYVNGSGVPDPSRKISYLGWVGRATYNYASRYLVEFNLGYTGSNQFNDQSRFGLFPAASVGWVLSEESFIKEHVKFLDYFKIRGSYGIVGNDNVGLDLTTYAYLSTYVPSGSYQFGESNTTYNGLAEGKLGNSTLTWEKERKANIGFDAQLFGSKMTLTFDYFDNYRYDIITTRATVGDIVGVSLPEVNLGKVSNKGLEFELGYSSKVGKVGYFVKGNIAVARNKVLYRDEERKKYPWLQSTGQSVGQPFGWTWIGFYESKEDIANSAVTAFNPQVGDLKYADLNGDGIINDDDKGPIGYPVIPNTSFGLSGGFNYKEFDFSVLFQGALNNSVRPTDELVYENIGNFQEFHLGRWTPENAANATFPKLHLASGGANNRPTTSTFWLRSGNYLRLKNFEIGYRIAPSVLKRIGIGSLRIYANGTNLFTWDRIKLLDPESPSGRGENYPQQKIYSLGLNLNF
ncbi:TonB-dependent receptor [Pedobacter sp. PLR]|uniref:SusC/RagA family TonB-linked outer membrane protein n=1 Tax=Pedobacter sp. PLR TaxID=2994465 RepID=UPI0022483285|nr:TonB-dependent receptor [Pedobacter sp. PLR]MCX2452053.1 TonB-dependent receptor [Pedobacter sp. PLR]